MNGKLFGHSNIRRKEIDEEYRTTLLNFRKYFNVIFAMAKIMEMTKEEQNQAALYLFNNIKKLGKDKNIVDYNKQMFYNV